MALLGGSGSVEVLDYWYNKIQTVPVSMSLFCLKKYTQFVPVPHLVWLSLSELVCLSLGNTSFHPSLSRNCEPSEVLPHWKRAR
jgi:hypothetical protein